MNAEKPIGSWEQTRSDVLCLNDARSVVWDV